MGCVGCVGCVGSVATSKAMKEVNMGCVFCAVCVLCCVELCEAVCGLCVGCGCVMCGGFSSCLQWANPFLQWANPFRSFADSKLREAERASAAAANGSSSRTKPAVDGPPTAPAPLTADPFIVVDAPRKSRRAVMQAIVRGAARCLVHTQPPRSMGVVGVGCVCVWGGGAKPAVQSKKWCSDWMT